MTEYDQSDFAFSFILGGQVFDMGSLKKFKGNAYLYATAHVIALIWIILIFLLRALFL